MLTRNLLALFRPGGGATECLWELSSTAGHIIASPCLKRTHATLSITSSICLFMRPPSLIGTVQNKKSSNRLSVSTGEPGACWGSWSFLLGVGRASVCHPIVASPQGEWHEMQNLHLVAEDTPSYGKNTYAYVLRNPQRLPSCISFERKQGAVIWQDV